MQAKENARPETLSARIDANQSHWLAETGNSMAVTDQCSSPGGYIQRRDHINGTSPSDNLDRFKKLADRPFSAQSRH